MAGGKGRNKFTEEEDRQLLQFLCSELKALNDDAYHPKGNKLWELAIERGVIKNHSVVAVRDRFRKVLCTYLRRNSHYVTRLISKKNVDMIRQRLKLDAPGRTVSQDSVDIEVLQNFDDEKCMTDGGSGSGSEYVDDVVIIEDEDTPQLDTAGTSGFLGGNNQRRIGEEKVSGENLESNPLAKLCVEDSEDREIASKEPDRFEEVFEEFDLSYGETEGERPERALLVSEETETAEVDFKAVQSRILENWSQIRGKEWLRKATALLLQFDADLNEIVDGSKRSSSKQ